MSSQVNPNLINSNYPVPGVNQPSQGFRTNFQAIQNSFKQYVLEMNDIINKAIVSAPLTYGSNSVINNFGGMLNSNLALFDYGLKVWSLGDISGPGTLAINFGNGSVQTCNLTGSTGGTQTINLSDFPGLGYSEIVLNTRATNVPQFINFANLVSGGSVVTNGGIGISGFNSSTGNFALTSTTPYSFTLGSLDGTNWTLKAPGTAVVKLETPASSIGTIGDTAGMIVSGSDYVYICKGNYDGVTAIWQRAALSNF